MGTPPGTVWSHRPAVFRAPLAPLSRPVRHPCTPLDGEAALFHDDPGAEMACHQSGPASGGAPRALTLAVGRFAGRYLSLSLDLPAAAVPGRGHRDILRLAGAVDLSPPLVVHARLNIRHGPNTERLTARVQLAGSALEAEFDLACSGMEEVRPERLWLDLIFEAPGATRIRLADLAVSRRPRNEF